MLRYLYIILGSISLFLGILGIVTPGLPTTPFILLTGFLYAKSSPRLYNWLENNKITGAYLKGLNGGLSFKVRLFLLALMWAMIFFTAFVIFEEGKMRYLMLILGAIGTVSQILFLKKKPAKKEKTLEKQRI